jgi:hypothetical protein
MKATALAICVDVWLLAAASTPALAQFEHQRRARLVGLHSVAVDVIDYPDAVPADMQTIRTQIEQRMLGAGLRIQATEYADWTLWATVAGKPTHDDRGEIVGYIARMDLELIGAQMVTLPRQEKGVAPIELWGRGWVGMLPVERSELQRRVERLIGELTDSFLDEWSTVNPKQD